MNIALHTWHLWSPIRNEAPGSLWTSLLYKSRDQGPITKGPAELAVKMPGLSLVLVQGQAPTTVSDAHIAFTVKAGDLNEMKAKL